MKQKDFEHLVKIGFLGNAHGEILNYTNEDLKPYKYKDVSEFIYKQMDEKIDYQNIIITFPVGTGYGTNGFYGPGDNLGDHRKVLISHAVHPIDVKQILESKGVSFKNYQSLTADEYSQYPIAMIIVIDGEAMVSDVYANPYSNNLAHSKSSKFKAIQINEKDVKKFEKNKTLSKLSWMFSGFFIANHKQRFHYEERVINVILNTIKDNQEYLCKKENLPQLAKLGYMYNTLWYAGRMCWGGEGIISKDGDCEDNPKYKIEMVNPKNERIENLVYDAWGMHLIERDEPIVSGEEFANLITKGKTISAFEEKARKPKKTMDEWVEVLTDKQYRYSSLYPNKKSVYDHLLCCIGNGYGIDKKGYVFREASGADQDIDLYGIWENAKFPPQIEKVVNEIISYPEVKQTLDTAHEYTKKEIEKYNKRFQSGFSDDDIKKLLQKVKKLKAKNPEKYADIDLKGLFDDTDDETEVIKEVYHQYYPICNYSIIHIINNPEKEIKPEPSVLQACIEICEEIIQHEKEERKENVKFAKSFLAKRGKEEFKSFIPKSIDKYALLKNINRIFEPVSKNFKIIKEGIINITSNKDSFMVYLNDTKKNDYADNNYKAYIAFSKETADKIGEGCSNDISILKDQPYYKDLTMVIDIIKSLEDVKHVSFHYANIKDYGRVVEINIIVNEEDSDYLERSENDRELVKQGFSVGNSIIEYPIEEMDIIFQMSYPVPFHKDHPDRGEGSSHYGVNKQLTVLTSDRKLIANFQFDERDCNYIQLLKPSDKSKKEIVEWILLSHKQMKASNPEYGTFEFSGSKQVGKEGERSLYAHDFVQYLKQHQPNKITNEINR